MTCYTLPKRLLALLLALLMGMLLAACGPEEPATTASAGTEGVLLLPTGTTAAPESSAATTEATTTEPVTTAVTTEPIIEEVLPPQIKNVILIIGDGMGLEHVIASELAYDKNYTFTEWQFANAKTNSLSGASSAVETTDSAASATALATGVLTNNGYVGISPNGRSLSTVLDYAKKLGKSTGIVTTDYLHGATPAGFSAHASNRGNTAEILLTQAASNVDFLCGSQDSTTLGHRSSYEQNGYTFVSDAKQIRTSLEAEKLCCAVEIEGYHEDARLTLSSATTYALEFLEKNEEGFCLMIEQAHIDKYSHDNNFVSMVHSVRSLANTVDRILAWLGDREDTAILVTADHETGGLNVSREKTLPNSYAGLADPVYYQWTSTGHTNSNVGLFVYGEYVDFERYSYYGAEYIVKNTDITRIMKDLLTPEEFLDPSES